MDSYTSRYLCNNCRLFSNTSVISIDFVITADQVIRTEEIGIVKIPLLGGTLIKLYNVALAPDCNSNLISLDQLQENEIIYYDNPTSMILMKSKKIIVHVKRERNFFMLDFVIPNQAMSARVMKIKGR